MFRPRLKLAGVVLRKVIVFGVGLKEYFPLFRVGIEQRHAEHLSGKRMEIQILFYLFHFIFGIGKFEQIRLTFSIKRIEGEP